MIIADTSIWIEFFKKHQPCYSVILGLMEAQAVLALSFVFGELYQGALNTKEMTTLKHYYQNLPHIDEANIWLDAGLYSNKNRLLAKGIGLIDAAIIIAALQNQAKIWTLDKKLIHVTPSLNRFSM